MSQSASTSPDQERYNRRLSDKIQSAFDHACDEGELEVAGDLLSTLELVLLRVPPKADRREAIVAPLMAAHERLWHLRAVGGKMVVQFAKDSEPAAKTELSGHGQHRT